MVRPLVKYWRSLAIKIARFLDDGLGINFDVNSANKDSQIVKETLLKSGFFMGSIQSIQSNYLARRNIRHLL